jgi:uncharacterized protein
VILYLDSSALLKLFVAEPGSGLVGEATARAAAVATHLIAYPELRAGLARAVRMNRLGVAALGPLVLEFERRWASLDVLAVSEPLIRRAGDLAARHGLRGYDSVHLAAVLNLRELAGAGRDLCFGVFDANLRAAALLHGLDLLPAG